MKNQIHCLAVMSAAACMTLSPFVSGHTETAYAAQCGWTEENGSMVFYDEICQILREKEIPQEFWEELLSDLPPMDAAVDKLLRQKLKNAEPDRKEVQRAVDALVRCGHNWSDIKAGLERFRSDLELEEPECL